MIHYLFVKPLKVVPFHNTAIMVGGEVSRSRRKNYNMSEAWIFDPRLHNTTGGWIHLDDPKNSTSSPRRFHTAGTADPTRQINFTKLSHISEWSNIRNSLGLWWRNLYIQQNATEICLGIH